LNDDAPYDKMTRAEGDEQAIQTAWRGVIQYAEFYNQKHKKQNDEKESD
jgi:hypothetical protein